MKVTVDLGDELFHFDSYMQWVNKATQWYGGCEYPDSMLITIDSKGRICRMGRHFMLARAEDAFPVSVYPRRGDEG